MQWNCPHCGVLLAVSDDTIGTGWSFSRCYKCGGFALVRRAEINVIKVDKAPLGERVILPEASRNPSIGLISEGAMKNFERHLDPPTLSQTKSEKPMIRPASSAHQRASVASHSASHSLGHSSGLPLPQIANSLQSHITQSPVLPLEVPPSESSSLDLPHPLPELVESVRSRKFRIGIAITSTAAVISGVSLFIQAQPLLRRTTAPVITDRVEQRAMAPFNKNHDITHSTKQESAAVPLKQNPSDLSKQEPSASAKAETSVPSEVSQGGPASPGVLPEALPVSQTDSVPTQSVNKQIQSEILRSPISLKVRVRNANLHTGPGLEYTVIGTAPLGSRFQSSQWSDRWFKVAFLNADSTTGYGWVRNDLVQVVSDVPKLQH